MIISKNALEVFTNTLLLHQRNMDIAATHGRWGNWSYDSGYARWLGDDVVLDVMANVFIDNPIPPRDVGTLLVHQDKEHDLNIEEKRKQTSGQALFVDSTLKKENVLSGSAEIVGCRYAKLGVGVNRLV